MRSPYSVRRATASTFLLGKYWYTAPMEVPARGDLGHGGGIETAFRDDGARGRQHVLHPPIGAFLLGDGSHGQVGEREGTLGL
jgi:hypothetical protein